MNTLNRNFRIVYVPLCRAKWPKDSTPSSPRVHTKGDHVLEMRRASELDYAQPSYRIAPNFRGAQFSQIAIVKHLGPYIRRHSLFFSQKRCALLNLSLKIAFTTSLL